MADKREKEIAEKMVASKKKKPQTFPVTINKVLIIAFPRKRPEDRFDVFRRWSKNNLMVKLGREPAEEEAEQHFAEWRKATCPNSYSLGHMVSNLNDFADWLGILRRQERARKAAKKRWSKRKKRL